MGTGRGSHSRSGSSSSSGSGSPPPLKLDPDRNRDGEEEEPADKDSSHPPGCSTTTVNSACSQVMGSSLPQTSLPLCITPEGVPSHFRSPVTNPARCCSPQGDCLHTGSPVSSHHSTSSSDADWPSERSACSLESSRPECGPSESRTHLSHHPQHESPMDYPPESSSFVDQTVDTSQESVSILGGPLDSSDRAAHRPESGIPLGDPTEPGGCGDPFPQSASPARLLDHHNLVQEEKLVAATLASLNQCGNPSNIIKQDLRFIIQSRRKAEGKEELRVDFKSPPKEELTEEEWQRALKRRDQNRRAAQRFRNKQRQISTSLADKVRQLEAAHQELMSELRTLETEKLSLLKLVYQHSRVCKDFDFKLKLQQALGYRLITSDPRKWPS